MDSVTPITRKNWPKYRNGYNTPQSVQWDVSVVFYHLWVCRNSIGSSAWILMYNVHTCRFFCSIAWRCETLKFFFRSLCIHVLPQVLLLVILQNVISKAFSLEKFVLVLHIWNCLNVEVPWPLLTSNISQYRKIAQLVAIRPRNLVFPLCLMHPHPSVFIPSL